ncbi:Pentatricopeptide repeat-containing protein [Hibiscus syriacus]|uniref:Pentatricopeptide repeat-containing protein n=1 Tax=Hibiscus syriacus TaxID=106335 RepID=A0A6A2XB28_HIBSY|nr:Pentatricopeptide repeat-containing protein [Hibiscus syriacus]
MSSPPITKFPTPKPNPHSLSQRTQIPLHVYQHPAAILLELSTSSKVHQILPHIIKSNLYTEHLFQTKLLSLFCNHGCIAEAARVFEPIGDMPEVLYYTLLKGQIEEAYKMFDGMPERDLVSWNTIISGFAQNGLAKLALGLVRMLDDGVEQTDVTIMGAAYACADLGDLDRGMLVHKLSDRSTLGNNVSVMNPLISMYSKCKRVDLAVDIFERLQGKTLVSSNAMILGFAQNGRVNDALIYFYDMHSRNLRQDTFTMVSVIPALAELSVTRQAKWIHGYFIRSCLDDDIFVMTAQVDMYSKCGEIHTARKLFNQMNERHVTTWNDMIDGYGTHGLGKAALELFNEMQKGTVKPNDVTFLSVLSACSHAGMVEEGRSYFTSMKRDYGIEPAMDHYGAMVGLLGRAGRLHEAWNFIQKMPIEPGINVYGAMLGACKIHKYVELSEKAASKLFALNPDEGGYHVLLANIYATASMWGEVAKVRNMMKKKGLQQRRRIEKRSSQFLLRNTNHPQSKRIYAFLEELGDKMKAAGYVPDTSSIHDVEVDVKEQLNRTHSERLAIAFSLLNTGNGTDM